MSNWYSALSYFADFVTTPHSNPSNPPRMTRYLYISGKRKLRGSWSGGRTASWMPLNFGGVHECVRGQGRAQCCKCTAKFRGRWKYKVRTLEPYIGTWLSTHAQAPKSPKCSHIAPTMDVQSRPGLYRMYSKPPRRPVPYRGSSRHPGG